MASTASQEVLQFCEKYNIQLNEQQAAALEAVNGANLLIAVPGSGKTTVLVARLGYMILCKGISPNEILAMTYTTAAAADMKERFASKFGKTLADRLQFRTINSVCHEIIQRYSRYSSKIPFSMIEENDRISIIKRIYREITDEFPTDVDVQNAELTITYIKNMRLSKEEMKHIETGSPSPAQFYEKYDNALRGARLMDFDDQMRYAIPILRDNPFILNYFQSKFRYICVDEAQDTSKLQHFIIRILSHKHNNIFMVGDEDQSIYGFRAAYPQALMDFKKDYPNANVLFMERNYRSKEEIVSAASKFIAANKNRYKKKFLSTQGNGGVIKAITVADRQEQYNTILEISRNVKSSTAILYRDNDCSIPLLDMFIRNRIPYRISKIKDTFFNHRSVIDIKAFLSLALDHNNAEAFMQIYYKCGFAFNKQFAASIKNQALHTKKTIPQIMKKESVSNTKLYAQSIAFEKFLISIKASRPYEAIEIINKKYEGYLRKNNLGTGKIDILKSIAKYEKTISDFLSRLDKLPELIRENTKDNEEAIILSTIHSAKGLEYERVYLMDVFDGVFPSVELSVSSSQADKELYEEERRLYYVGVTRAKKELYLFNLADKKCSFVSETVPKILPDANKNTAPISAPTVSVSSHRLSLGGNSKRTLAQAPLSISESLAAKVVIDGRIYTIGSPVHHKINGKGKITEMSLIANDIRRHQVIIEFENGRIGKFELEVLIKMHLLSLQ